MREIMLTQRNKVHPDITEKEKKETAYRHPMKLKHKHKMVVLVMLVVGVAVSSVSNPSMFNYTLLQVKYSPVAFMPEFSYMKLNLL